MNKPAAFFGLDAQMVETNRVEREAMYLICPFQNVDFRELLDEYELTDGDSFPDTVDLFPSDLSDNV